MDQRSKGQKRKPLSDLTNTTILLPISSSSSFKPKSKTSLRPVASVSRSETSIGSSNVLEQPPQCPTNSEPNSPHASALLKNFDHEDFEHSKTYSRQRVEVVKNKGKAAATSVPSSCPPVGRTKNLGDRRKNLENADVLKTCLVPQWKSKRKRRHSMPEERVHALPQDFIDKQRAYFAEIDAFDLLEEEVSESELE